VVGLTMSLSNEKDHLDDKDNFLRELYDLNGYLDLLGQVWLITHTRSGRQYSMDKELYFCPPSANLSSSSGVH